MNVTPRPPIESFDTRFIDILLALLKCFAIIGFSNTLAAMSSERTNFRCMELYTV
jgi:hypothetical protein